MSTRTRRLSSLAGAVAAVFTLGAIFVATLLSPGYSWTIHPLSALGGEGGVATPTTRLVFNGGLVAGGLLGFGFAPAILAAARNRVELAGIGVFGVVLLALSLIGVFSLPHPLHVPVAVAFFGLLSVALGTYGVGNWLAGDRRRGALTVGLGVLNNTSWTLWVLTGEVLRPGIAIPELLGALAFGLWALATTVDVRRRLGFGDSPRLSSENH